MTLKEAQMNMKGLQDSLKEIMKDSNATYTQIKALKVSMDKAYIDLKTLERLSKKKAEGKTYEV